MDGHKAQKLKQQQGQPLNTPPTVTDRLVHFWYEDLPPLYGPLRLVYYSLTWLVTFRWFPIPSGPLDTLLSVQKCTDSYNGLLHFSKLRLQYPYQSGIFGYFLSTLDDPSSFWMFNCSALVGILNTSLVLCALGFGWKVPRVLAAFTFCFLKCMNQTAWNGGGVHSTLLGCYAFVALCFAENNLVDRWSLDSLLLSMYQGVGPSGPSCIPRKSVFIVNGASAGGAARKFIMCVVVVSFFFAGTHKLSEAAWPGWLAGGALRHAINRQNGHWPWLHNLVADNDWLCIPLAFATVIGEIGAIAILIWKRWRPFGIASFFLFHIGVYLMMLPNFFAQCIVYLLIIEWSSHYEQFLGKRKVSVKSESAPIRCSGVPRSWRVGAWLYSSILATFFLAALFRIDGLPFYSWDLYSGIDSPTPFMQETIEHGSHNCMTQPPLNPLCQHLGSSSTVSCP